MLNVKQGSCEYQLLKSFGLIWPRNQTQVYRIRGERSNFWATRRSGKYKEELGDIRKSALKIFELFTSILKLWTNNQVLTFQNERDRTSENISPNIFSAAHHLASEALLDLCKWEGES